MLVKCIIWDEVPGLLHTCHYAFICESYTGRIIHIVGAVRAKYIVFGSDSSKSTIFGIDVAKTILCRVLTGTKTNDPWSRHIGEIQNGCHPVRC